MHQAREYASPQCVGHERQSLSMISMTSLFDLHHEYPAIQHGMCMLLIVDIEKRETRLLNEEEEEEDKRSMIRPTSV